MEKKHKHLEFIQLTITRMAANSFLIKGWNITLISALFALSAGGSNLNYAIVSFLPLPVFWVLDGYYLWQERLYRALYDNVRNQNDNEIDYSMNTQAIAQCKCNWICAVFSKTLILFYGLTVFIMIVVMGIISKGG